MCMSLIAAVSCNGVIGRDGALPWHLPADLAHFKAHTEGRTVLMGRRTFESIGRALPRRRNVVLTRRVTSPVPGIEYARSLAEAKQNLAGDQVVIIGGAGLYAEAIDFVSTMHLTVVHHQVEGDVSFPDFDTSLWSVRSAKERVADEKNPMDMTFLELVRRSENPQLKPLMPTFPRSYCH